jgi:lipopolysaccharide export system protein LptA
MMRTKAARRGRLLILAASLAPALAGAERADRNQPTLIVADHQTVDDLKQVSVFTGHVVLTKGTIRVTGERMEYREDPEGYQYAVVTAGEDSTATFHQRRDPTRPGVEETIDGVAERIEYDNRADTVKLFTRAIVRRFENGVMRDEFTGDRITYEARTSHYDLIGTGSGPSARVTARIAPRINESTPPEQPTKAVEPAHGPPASAPTGSSQGSDKAGGSAAVDPARGEQANAPARGSPASDPAGGSPAVDPPRAPQ